MKRTYESAIAEFFQGGGEVRRIETPVRVSERDFRVSRKCGLR